MIEKIISGGQTGADIAGIKAAKELGILTGGWMPAGFLTEDGNMPEYEEEYGLMSIAQSGIGGYIERTRLNVIEADATVIFSFSNKERGSTLTKKFCQEERKPFIWIGEADMIEATKSLIKFLREHNPKILNIAGNRESLYPGIERFVTDCIDDVITGLKFFTDTNSQFLDHSRKRFPDIDVDRVMRIVDDEIEILKGSTPPDNKELKFPLESHLNRGLIMNVIDKYMKHDKP